MTASAAFRCSIAAELRGDPMLGTAPPQRRVLLVHQPGPWGPRGLLESRCDPEVARRIDEASAKNGMRLQAVRRPGKHEPARPAGGYEVGIADTVAPAANVTWWRVDDLSEIADELERGWPTRTPVGIDTDPLYLVCTHGKHDPCCALRGRPVAEALHRIRPGRVWETSHLGGDRFAANLLILPAGDLYGRVTVDVAAELVRTAEAQRVLPDLLRGRIGLTPPAQAALAFAYRELDIVERDGIAIMSVRRLDDARTDVNVRTSDANFVIEVESEVLAAARLTCHGAGDARARAYRAIGIRALA